MMQETRIARGIIDLEVIRDLETKEV